MSMRRGKALSGLVLLLIACSAPAVIDEEDLPADAGTETPEEVGLPDQCEGQCNAVTPGYPTVSGTGGFGDITMYTTVASDGGACNYGTTSVVYFAAMSVNVEPGDGKGQWQHGRICGQCVEVTALTSQGPKSVVIRIMDKCPDGFCGVDLGGDAPSAIMVDGFGRYDGSWKFVSCSGHPEVSDGEPVLFVMRGSNPWWSRVQVRNPPAPVDTMEWRDASNTGAVASGTFPYATDPENMFEVPVESVLQSPMTAVQITIRYRDGSSATAELTPAQLATTDSYPLTPQEPQQDPQPVIDPERGTCVEFCN